MSLEDLPAPVRAFISEHLSSVEQLEILLLLVSDSSVEWTAQSVYKTVMSTMASVEQRLENFTAAGFLNKSSDPTPKYRVILRGEQERTVSDVCRLYRERPVKIIEAIYQKNRSAAQEFANAFKFKRDL
ncbi:MAG: hypothetical protein V4727_01115 [Verrucomicrobiota bacterium]